MTEDPMSPCVKAEPGSAESSLLDGSITAPGGHASPAAVAMWDAINQFAVASGGRADVISSQRMTAVVAVSKAIEARVQEMVQASPRNQERPRGAPSSAVQEVADERLRQVQRGYTEEHDDKPLLVHIDRNGESLCAMELHFGDVPLTAEPGEVTCVGCWILRDEEALQAVAEVERLRNEIANIHCALDAREHDGNFGAAAKMHNEVVTLRAEIVHLREPLDTLRAAVTEAARHCDCGDNSCAFRLKDTGGAGTNGGCDFTEKHHKPFAVASLAALFRAALRVLSAANGEFQHSLLRSVDIRDTIVSALPPTGGQAQEMVEGLIRDSLREQATRTILESPTIKKLRGEVARLRRASEACLTLLEALEEGEPWARKSLPRHLSQLRAEIEREP